MRPPARSALFPYTTLFRSRGSVSGGGSLRDSVSGSDSDSGRDSGRRRAGRAIGSARDADGNLIPSSANEAAPYVGIFSTQAFAEDMVDFIVRWYSEGGAQVLCRSEASSGGVTVTCKRR